MKKMISLLLVLVMLLGIFPVTALAATTGYKFSDSAQVFLTPESAICLNVAVKLTRSNGSAISPSEAARIESRVGLLVWGGSTSDVSGATYNADTGRFEMQYEVAPRKLGDALTLQPYYIDGNGNYTYGRQISNYCPKDYCYDRIAAGGDDTDLMIAMLNYCAASQEYFEYNTDSLVNAKLTEAQKVLNWDDSLLSVEEQSIPTDKQGKLFRDPVVNKMTYSVNAESINCNIYVQLNTGTGIDVHKAEMLLWTEEDYNAVTVLTEENASQIVDMPFYDGVRYGVSIDVAAKDIFSHIYACGKITDTNGNVYYGGVRDYSVSYYARILLDYTGVSVTTELRNLLKWLIIYGDAARAYAGEAPVDVPVTSEKKTLTLSLYEIGNDAASDADDVLLPGATVHLYVGNELRFSTKDGDDGAVDGKVTLDLTGLEPNELAAATVSAVKSYTHCLTPEDNRYPLFSQFGTDAWGNAERYILEVRSEIINERGNWGRHFVLPLLYADEAQQKLVLKEPRMLVNLAVSYKDVDGTQSMKNTYREAVEETISIFSQDLAQTTDGHVMVNKVLIGATDDERDFFFHKLHPSDRGATAAKLAGMADIQIKSTESEGTRIGSAAYTEGFYMDKAHSSAVLEGKYVKLPETLTQSTSGRKIFPAIQTSGTSKNGYGVINERADYCREIAHEAGHYILGFRDEYESGYNLFYTQREWFWNLENRPVGAPRNFGLMEYQYGKPDNLEMSWDDDYEYLKGDYSNPSINSEQSYENKASCETFMANNLIADVRSKLNCGASYAFRTADRTASYPNAALNDEDFIPFDGEQLAYPEETVALMTMAAMDEPVLEEADAETVEVTTDGYLYFTPAETVCLYVVPEETTEYTFTDGTSDGVNGEYFAVNQSVIIEAEEGEQTVQGELYSVASIDDDIDYNSVQWFVCQNGIWQALETDLTREENGNIGGRCDYVGAGEYVVMARSASAIGLMPITDLTWSQSTTHDAVIELQFADQNAAETVNHYRIYVSDAPFDETMLDQVEFIRWETTEGTASVELVAEGVTAYVAVVAVGPDGAKSTLSEVTSVTSGAADSDGDGLPNWYCDQYLLWETDEGVTPAAADKDGDGFTNMEEYLQGTDPTIPETCEVVFERNGGSAVEAQTVIRMQCAVEPTAPAKEGYEFLGWYSDVDLTNVYDFTTAVTSNATLYARWKAISVPGDINGDGETNLKDLTRLFQYLADWDVEVNEAVLDVNGDGSINLKDQTRLFQYLADWDVEIYPAS